ncbi:putative phosphoenolpyruvate carboxylase 4-like [Capsicum annuum]|nr:putative phosphoenolpyruvate carboxylase 4-like [Capsicum annuum]
MLLYKTKKIQPEQGNRLLISITVVGSAGPIRFVVNEKELVANVLNTALKNYAREGRLPVLGSKLNDFVLYCPTVASEGWRCGQTLESNGFRLSKSKTKYLECKFSDTSHKSDLSPWETIGSFGVRNFVLVKKPQAENSILDRKQVDMARKGAGSWRAWFNKSLSRKIASY